jgi:hypothetical protein
MTDTGSEPESAERGYVPELNPAGIRLQAGAARKAP